ncbi:MAG: hypothetical protein FJ267_11540 [Planctomycetes bacterium]|nr:hypothetical protein [Planctomycetota bacterium]
MYSSLKRRSRERLSGRFWKRLRASGKSDLNEGLLKLNSESNDIQILDEWYQRKCDGMWEHRRGVRIETCDNPGWLVIFDDLPLDQQATADWLKSFLHQYGAQVIAEGQEVRVFARSLKVCLSVAAKLIDSAPRSGHGQ